MTTQTPNRTNDTTSNLRRNYLFHIGDGVFFFFAMTFISYEEIIPVFIQRLGGTNIVIALIPFIINLGTSLPSLFTANLVESVSRKKPYTLLFGMGQRLPWLVVGVASFFLSAGHPSLLIVIILAAVLIVNTSTGLVVPAWFDLVAKTVPMTARGRLFSIRAAVSYFLGIAGGALVKRILDTVAYPLNFSLLFIIAFVLLSVSLASVAMIREPNIPVKRKRGRFADFLRRFPAILRDNPSFRYFAIARSLFLVALSSISFYAVFTLAKFDLDTSYTGIFIVITALTFVVVNPLLGLFADRFGHKTNFVIAAAALVVSNAVCILSGNLYIMFVIFFLAASAKSIKILSSLSMTAEFCADEDRPIFIAVSALFTAPASFAALALGYLADRFGYEILFAAALCFAFVSFLIFLFKVKEPRKHIHARSPY
jgi:MFS family permease